MLTRYENIQIKNKNWIFIQTKNRELRKSVDKNKASNGGGEHTEYFSANERANFSSSSKQREPSQAYTTEGVKRTNESPEFKLEAWVSTWIARVDSSSKPLTWNKEIPLGSYCFALQSRTFEKPLGWPPKKQTKEPLKILKKCLGSFPWVTRTLIQQTGNE